MITIIKDYLKKISIHSESLNRTDKYINKPWIHIDLNGNKHKYIFNADGDLFMSFNGRVEVGKWKYMPEANLIFIDRLTDKIFLKQSFLDESVMILKIDSTNDELFVLANENIIPNYDVTQYLSTLNFESLKPGSSSINYERIDKNTFFHRKLLTGETFSINRLGKEISTPGMSVLLNGSIVRDGLYFASSEQSNILLGYHVVNSKINSVFWRFTYNLAIGNLSIDRKYEECNFKGDLVLLNGNIAPNGKYSVGFMECIKVTNGVISNLSVF